MAVRDQTDQMFENNDRVLRFTFMDEDVSPAVPLDLTIAGRVSRFVLARFGANGPIRANPVVLKDEGVGGEINVDPGGAGTNIADVILIAADTAGLAAAGSTPYYFEYEITDGGTVPLVLATGTLTIDPNVENA